MRGNVMYNYMYTDKLSAGTKTHVDVQNNEMPVLSGCPKAGFDCTTTSVCIMSSF